MKYHKAFRETQNIIRYIARWTENYKAYGQTLNIIRETKYIIRHIIYREIVYIETTYNKVHGKT